MQIIITGDKSRYQFLRNIVNQEISGEINFFLTAQISENDIYVTSDKKKLEGNVYYSSQIPLNTMLFFPGEYNSSVEYKINEKIVFFDEFPYKTERKMEQLNEIIHSNSYGQLEIILVYNNRNALESDITTEKTAMEETESEYKKQGLCVSRYDGHTRPDYLFWSLPEQVKQRPFSLGPIVDDVKIRVDTFESCYDLQYEFDLGMLLEDPMILDSFFEYTNEIKGRNVWEVYYERICNYFWKDHSDIENFITDRYREGIAELCIWDISVDLLDLNKNVRKLFADKMQGFEDLIFEGEKNDYSGFLNKNKKNILEFKQRIKTFFSTDLKTFLKMRIIKHIERMEELIK